jgi:small GTP-binding protein
MAQNKNAAPPENMNFKSVVRRITEGEGRVKIIIVGPDNAGKTTLLKSFLGEDVEDIPPTFGYQIIEHRLSVGESSVEMKILDIGGQEAIRGYWDTYYEETDGVIFVYDSHDPRDHSEMLSSLIKHPVLYESVFLCISNKVDSGPGERDPVRVKVSRLESVGEEVPFDFMKANLSCSREEELREIRVIETSAYTGKNVRRAFMEIISEILRKRALPSDALLRSLSELALS